jgi:hypothetical protein
MRTEITIVGNRKVSGCFHPTGDDDVAESVKIQVAAAPEYDTTGLDRGGKKVSAIVVKWQLVDKSILRLRIEEDGCAIVHTLCQGGYGPEGGHSGDSPTHWE